MKIFQCSHCQQAIFFENVRCEECRGELGFLPARSDMLTRPPGKEGNRHFRDSDTEYAYCKNQEYRACNWLVPVRSGSPYCLACKLNRSIPEPGEQDDFHKWQSLESAKHRLIYQLHTLKLPLHSKMEGETGLCFDFVSRKTRENAMTGHAGGVITLVVTEADSVHRELMRKQLSEPYRTLIGHFRHETGHYYWDLLIREKQPQLQGFRDLFGDERSSYPDSLQKYYKEGPPENWQHSYISRYAAAHPWEDWAESWAHYLHLMDTLETAYYFGLRLHPPLQNVPYMQAEVVENPYLITDFNALLTTSIPVFFAVNGINRAMGLPDAYPFVINPGVVAKMNFIHELLRKFRKV